MEYRRIKGTQDLLPQECVKWQRVEEVIKEELAHNNYKEVRTPIFEDTQLFTRSIGEETDVVSKEMYTFLDKGENSITLRPELTAPVIRAYIQDSTFQNSPIEKWYYFGPAFRQEKPQKGRFRQFHQFGFELIGTDLAVADAEVIQTMYRIFSKLGLKEIEIKINSIGSLQSRKKYLVQLRDELSAYKDQLCETCQKRFQQNILRIFDCKNETCQEILDQHAPLITDNISDEDKKHFETVKKLLKETNTPFTVDKKLVRGLDYYTRTTFEITSSLLGSQDAICGGGRYDHLVEDLGGPEIPAVGVACGMERLILALDEEDQLEVVERPLVFCITMGERARDKGFEIVTKLRNKGINAEMDLLQRSIRAQMRYANKDNADKVIIIGDQELERNVVALKDMKSGDQEDVPIKDLISTLIDRFKISNNEPIY
ncbi:MAG: histidine--tRNA ligase [Candidatus Marinimicrobia bacterium]|nr:histidine--tRNA ligase [Candidatus Neomarinimicrobiota bacterium]